MMDVDMTADEVAAAMKSWAISKGATHYTHWFQPLTGTTAEKHDSFFTLKGDGTAIEEIFIDITKNVVRETVKRNKALPATQAIQITTMAGCSAVK